MIYGCSNPQCVNLGVLVDMHSMSTSCRYCGMIMQPSYALQQPAQLLDVTTQISTSASSAYSAVRADIDNVRQEIMKLRSQFDQLVTFPAVRELVSSAGEKYATLEFVDPVLNALNERIETLEKRIDRGDVTW